ncbi:MAG: hypothetical protein MHPSP_004552, partial [Paramarteilia canceri]
MAEFATDTDFRDLDVSRASDNVLHLEKLLIRSATESDKKAVNLNSMVNLPSDEALIKYFENPRKPAKPTESEND